MKKFLYIPTIITSLFVPALLVIGQTEGQSGGGESAAESSVTTSSSKKSAAAPETIESNPVVTVVKSGLPIQTAIAIPVTEMVQVAEAGGTLTNLKTTATGLVQLQSQGKDVSTVISNSVKAINNGIKFTSSTGQGFLDVAVSLTDGKIQADELTTVKTNLDSGVDLTIQEGIGVSRSKSFLDSGMSGAQMNTDLKGLTGDSILIKNADKAIASGIKYSTSSGQGFLDVAESMTAGKISENDLLDIKSNLDSGIDLSIQETAGVAYVKSELAKGISPTKLNNELKGKTGTELDAAKEKVTTIADLVQQGVDENDADTIAESGGDASMADFIKEVYAIDDSDDLKSITAELFAYKNTDGELFYSDASQQLAFKSAFSIFSQFLNNYDISSASDLPVEISYASLTNSDNPYVIELIKLFVVYGAFGDSAEKIITDLGFDEAGGLDNLFTQSTSTASLLADSTASSDFFNFLKLVTDSDIGDPDNDNDSFLDPTKNSAINIARDDFSISAGNTISIGSESATTEIDISSKLPPAPNNNSANTPNPDRKVYAIVAAKDLIIKGDTTFANQNDVEDHAFALASAGDLSFRSEISPNNPDYDNPDPINLTYTGSNLGLGSEDTMTLVNVNISTGGNLAIGSLSDLQIGLKDGHESTFSVGTGGENSDPDNVYLYANELLSINGLQFAGRVDDVYMDAITISLKNVAFPNTSEVMARSRDGSINAGTGSVNFLGGVYHGSDLIDGTKGAANNHFNGKDGHWDLNKKLENGKSAFVIRKK